jgi:3,2-trans-enoyl-CoA isomerase
MGGLRIERAGDFRVWRLAKERGNALDESLVEDLGAAARAAAQDPTVKGILLATAHPKIFCPGLDLITFADYDRASLGRFLAKLVDTMGTLFGLGKPVVAALGGHAVAGGFLLALTADHRVLRRGGFKIGLNEGKVGVPIPRPLVMLLRASLPPSALTPVVLLGRNFTDEAAVAMGLCDELADAAVLETVALSRLAELAEKDPVALGKLKGYLRAEVLATMQRSSEEAISEFLDCWFLPATQQRIRQAVTGLAAG